ncbi:hypothetical protein AB1Y20_020155 [Prymnesium parvum]|uniref:Uncharacterized protein n=1 Tax=Prymnesium parvum TaxID=97485 RepID=A0AB34JWI0_PRYPA
MQTSQTKIPRLKKNSLSADLPLKIIPNSPYHPSSSLRMPPFGVLSARLQQTLLAVQYMDPSARLELFSLLSLGCCLIGAENTPYMLSTNLAVALLGLIGCRGGSEAQLVALCLFCLLTTICDVVSMCTQPSRWGGLWSALNIVMKAGAASSGACMSATLRGVTAGDALDASADDTYQGYQGPVAHDDYLGMAAEAVAGKQGGISDPSTSYRAI